MTAQTDLFETMGLAELHAQKADSTPTITPVGQNVAQTEALVSIAHSLVAITHLLFRRPV